MVVRSEARHNADAILIPISQKMRGDIERKIMSGEWLPGTRIPVEHQLMATYGCSRMTVSKVLSDFASRGLINRNKGSGSEVAAPLAERAVLEIRDFAKEAAKAGVSNSHDVLGRKSVMADAATAARLGVARKARLIAVQTLHKIGGKPEAYESRLINVGAVRRVARESFKKSPPGTWLLEHVPWTSAEHAVAAINADRMLADLLRVEEHSACLVLERRTWQLDALVTEAKIFYPGALHRLIGRFSPTRA